MPSQKNISKASGQSKTIQPKEQNSTVYLSAVELRAQGANCVMHMALICIGWNASQIYYFLSEAERFT